MPPPKGPCAEPGTYSVAGKEGWRLEGLGGNSGQLSLDLGVRGITSDSRERNFCLGWQLGAREHQELFICNGFGNDNNN